MQEIVGKLHLPFEGECVCLQQMNAVSHPLKLWDVREVPLIEYKVGTKIAI